MTGRNLPVVQGTPGPLWASRLNTALLADEHSKLVTGRYYGPMIGALTTTSVTQSLAHAIPMWNPQAGAIDRIESEVTTLSAGSIRMGVYLNNDATDLPGTLLFDAGTVSAATATVKSITIAQTLPQGLVWLVAVSQGAATTMRTLVGGLAPVAPTSFIGASATAVMNCYTTPSITGALPGTWGASTAASTGIKIMVRAV